MAMIVYRLWVRHPNGQPDLHCPVVLCDACGLQVTKQGNVYWVPGDDRLWHTHKHPCSELDQAIEAQTNKHVLFEELDVWLNQLHVNFDRESLPLTEIEERSA
jgi:hypothetical protein